MKCENCGQKIRPGRAEAMTDKDGRVFCDIDCAFDFYIDLMRLVYVQRAQDETDGGTHDNNGGTHDNNGGTHDNT